jgi:hypothetical protein
MRELKFQILDKLNRNEELLINNLGKIFVIDQGCGQANEADDQENYVIRQYTGVKDKNGKEIYEGDILMPDTIDGIWSEQRNGVLVKDIRQPFANAHLFKIIGNVFENPELIKNK